MIVRHDPVRSPVDLKIFVQKPLRLSQVYYKSAKSDCHLNGVLVASSTCYYKDKALFYIFWISSILRLKYFRFRCFMVEQFDFRSGCLFIHPGS